MPDCSFPGRGPSNPGAPRGRLAAVACIPVLAVAVAVTASATIAGCYWLRYHDLLLTHVALMSTMATDAAEQLSFDARPLAPADIERLRYPLQRARRFLDVSRGGRSDLGSFRAFEGFVDAYGKLVHHLDRVRVGVPRAGQIAVAERRAADLEARAEVIRAEVARETG